MWFYFYGTPNMNSDSTQNKYLELERFLCSEAGTEENDVSDRDDSRLTFDQFNTFAKVICNEMYKPDIRNILVRLGQNDLLTFVDILLTLISSDKPENVAIRPYPFVQRICGLYVPSSPRDREDSSESQDSPGIELEKSENLQLEYGTRNSIVTLTKPADESPIPKSSAKRCNAYSKKVHTLPNTVWVWDGLLYHKKYNQFPVPKPPNEWFFGGGGKRDDDNCTIHIPGTLKNSFGSLHRYAGKTISVHKVNWEQFLYLAGQLLFTKSQAEVDKPLKFWMDVITEKAISHGKRYGPSRIRKEQRREMLDAWIQIYIFEKENYRDILDYYLRAGYVVNITNKRGWQQHKTICLDKINNTKKRKRSA
jgi:hypothetical protein